MGKKSDKKLLLKFSKLLRDGHFNKVRDLMVNKHNRERLSLALDDLVHAPSALDLATTNQLLTALENRCDGFLFAAEVINNENISEAYIRTFGTLITVLGLREFASKEMIEEAIDPIEEDSDFIDGELD